MFSANDWLANATPFGREMDPSPPVPPGTAEFGPSARPALRYGLQREIPPPQVPIPFARGPAWRRIARTASLIEDSPLGTEIGPHEKAIDRAGCAVDADWCDWLQDVRERLRLRERVRVRERLRDVGLLATRAAGADVRHALRIALRQLRRLSVVYDVSDLPLAVTVHSMTPGSQRKRGGSDGGPWRSAPSRAFRA